ncbi:MAG TPA: hypothetical protein VGA13_10285 [Acidimicrobiales bacterium]|jgi:hypothetical protein
MSDNPPSTNRLTEVAAERRAKLLDGIDRLRTSSPVAQLLSERTLMVIAAALAPTGLLLILVGWAGAAGTPNLYEQVPYLISGGIFGLGLAVLGGFFYFAHWIAELVKEQRRQTETLVAAIDELRHNDDLSRAITELSERLETTSPPRSKKRAARTTTKS